MSTMSLHNPLIPLVSLASACAVDSAPVPEDCLAATLAKELDGETSCEPASGGAKADRLGAIETPGLRFLRSRNERELAALFADGTADHVPIGRNDGLPLLLGLDWLAPKISRVYVGSIWEPMGELGADGDPEIRLRDAWLRTRDGHLVTKFEAEVSRGVLDAIEGGPTGRSRSHPLIPIYRDRLELDGRPSLFVDYQRDPTPVINRILDEIREVDAERCPGLFLGRAHYLRPGGEWVYLYWFALDFGSGGEVCEL